MAKKRKGIKTSSCKNKGRKHQQYIKNKILEHFLFLGEGDVESRSMGASGTDIIMSPLARRAFPLSIEAKKTKTAPSRAELKQSQANTYKDTIAAVVWAPHGAGSDKSIIFFDFNDFIEWYKNIAKDTLNKLKENYDEDN